MKYPSANWNVWKMRLYRYISDIFTRGMSIDIAYI